MIMLSTLNIARIRQVWQGDTCSLTVSVISDVVMCVGGLLVGGSAGIGNWIRC